MAGVSNKPVTSGVNWGGYTDLGNGLALYSGTGVFVTSGTSVVIYHPFGTGPIYFATASPVFATASQAANGQLTISVGTIDTTNFGTFKSTTAGQATVKRIAGTDSALSFQILMIGQAKH